MRNFRLLISMALVLVLTPAAVPAATPQEVDASIEKAIAYIYGQEKNGTWEDSPLGNSKDEQTAVTAMAVYALLAAGENAQDPRIDQAVKFIEKTPTPGVYALGLRCQVWLNMPVPYSKDVRDAVARDAEALIQGAHPDPNLTAKEIPSAFYRYVITANDWDHSNSQYGVLGLWACAQTGYEVPLKYWQAVDAGWRAHQFTNGSWAYGYPGPALPPPPAVVNGQPVADEHQPRVTMTAAGIATLFVAQEYLHGMDGIDCPGNVFDPNIEAGLDWMSKNFAGVYGHNANYGLYGIERIGVASGRKYFGDIDWYKEGADYLVKSQHPAGDWGWNIIDTGFSLLFLIRGRAPVVMNKLQYDLNMHGDKPKVANWNQRPRDAANITRWIGKQLERPLNWQIVSLRAPPEDLHDAPILYLAGNQPLDFTDQEMAKLKHFVEEGGLIVGNADCASISFEQGIRRVSRRLFPDYELRYLPPESPIFTHEQFMRTKWKNKPEVEAISNGARELVILIPKADPGRYWQTQTYFGHEELYQLMSDIFLYTVDRGEMGGLKNKGETYVVQADPAIHPAKIIKLARLQYPGNWDPEPGSWPRLAAILHNTQDTDLVITNFQLGNGLLNNGYKVAHLTGTFKFTLPAAMRNEIQNYVNGGGTLIVDACGGDAAFAQSAQKEIAAIFPQNVLGLAPLGLNDPAYVLGPKLDHVEYRSFARTTVRKLNTPRIRALTINGRPAVFFSGEDLSCGMVGMHTDGIYGYQPASATALMEKLVLFAGK